MLDLPHYGAQDMQVTARDLDLAHCSAGCSPVTPELHDRADFAGDSAVPPLGTVQAVLEPSRLAGAGIDSGRARAVRRPAAIRGLLARRAAGSHHHGVGSLGWTRGTRASWRSTSTPTVSTCSTRSSGGSRAMPRTRWPARRRGRGNRAAGRSARVLLRLEGSLDSLGLDARASVERLAWRAWRSLPAGVTSPGNRSRPDVRARRDTGLDCPRRVRILRGVRGGSRTADSLTWLARARIGEGGAFLAGGRFARRADLAGRTALASAWTRWPSSSPAMCGCSSGPPN